MRIPLLVLLGASVMQLTAAPLGLTNLVVFGDSLSDDGNASIASGGLFPGANYAPGMYTDGPNTTPATNGPLGLWVNQFAAATGLPNPTPYLAGGSNFAVASADTGTNGSFFVGDQVLAYEKSVNFGALSPNTLYSFWAGANDLVDGVNPTTAADNVASYIKSLGASGARNFLWLDLPPVGDTPKALAENLVVPGTSAALNAAAAAYNSEWQVDLYQLEALGYNVVGVDVNSIFEKIAADYAAGCQVSSSDPYCFANINSPAQGQNVNPNTYLFWDDQHPTTQADSLIAGLAIADLQAVPEPASLALCGFALAAAAAGKLRRRKQA